MPELTLYQRYTRKEARDLLDPSADYTPGAGTWGLSGVINIQSEYKHFVFFVTYGQEQSGHIFREGITKDGILSWQSQPSQKLKERRIQHWINQKSNNCRISLFVRNSKKKSYIYAGELLYVEHDENKEKPVWFSFQINEWRYLPQLHSEINPLQREISSKDNQKTYSEPLGFEEKKIKSKKVLLAESEILKDLIDVHPEVLGVDEGKEIEFDHQTTVGSNIPLLVHAPGKEKIVIGLSDYDHDSQLFKEMARVIRYSVELAIELGEPIGSTEIKAVLFIKPGDYPVTSEHAKKYNVALIPLLKP